MKRFYLWFFGLICFFNCQAQLPKMDQQIRSIFQDSKGVYWFGTNNSGVYRYDNKTLTQFSISNGLADNQVLSIQEDENGHLWFGSGSFTVSCYDGQQMKIMANRSMKIKDMKSIKDTTSAGLWFFAGGGALNYRAEKMTYMSFQKDPPKGQSTSPFSLSRFGVYSILKDQQGNIWFGTQAEGVCKYDGGSFTWFKEQGLAGPAVLALYADSKGHIWFGNNGTGLFRYDGTELTQFSNEPKLKRIYSITEDNNGTIWIGTVDAGIWTYNGQQFQQFQNYTLLNGLPSNAVNTIYKDAASELWFGTDKNGLFRFDGVKFYKFEFQ